MTAPPPGRAASARVAGVVLGALLLALVTDAVSRPVEAPAAAPGASVAVVAPPGAPATLIARIVTPDGAAQPGARVHVELERDGSVAADTVADETGMVRLSALPEGRYLVRVEHDGFAVGAAVHRFPAESVPDIALRPASTVSGQVLGPDGLPTAGAEVRIVGSGLWPALTTSTDGTGRFVLSAIPPGIYEVHARRVDADGSELSAPPRRGLSIAPGDRAVLSFVLSGGVSLAGTVLDDDTGEPVAGAEVRLGTETLAVVARTAITGADGTFRFAGLEDRAHRLSISDDIHVPEIGIEASPGAILRIRLSRGASISGIVVDADRRPVANAAIEVLGSGARGLPITVGATASIAASAGVPGRLEVTEYVPPIPLVPGESMGSPLGSEPSLASNAGRVRTGADGTFHVEGVPPGLVQVVARAAEHASASSDAFRLRSGEARQNVEIVLAASGRLEGTVIDENDEVVAGLLVEVRSESDPLTRIAVTDADGHFAMNDLAGSVRVRANAHDRPPSELRAEVPSGGSRNVTVRLEQPGLALNGEVVDARGRAVEGAQVRVVSLRAEGSISRTVFTDSSGRFVADRVAAPPLRVVVEHPEFATSGGIEVDGLDDVRIALSSALTAAGTVIDPWTGLGVPGAEVTLVSEAVPPVVRSVTADDDGLYQVLRLGPGRWARRVSAEGYATTEDRVMVRANRWGEVELDAVEISPGVTFEGDVVDRLGQIVVGAEVMLDGDPALLSRTDEHGHFVLAAVAPGEHEARVIHGAAGEASHAFEARSDRAPSAWVAHLPGRNDEDVVGRRAERGVPVELGDDGEIRWLDPSMRALGVLPGDVVVAVDGRISETPDARRSALTGTGATVLRLSRDGSEFHVVAPRRLWTR